MLLRGSRNFFNKVYGDFKGILRVVLSPRICKTLSAHILQQLIIASIRVKCRLPIGIFAETADDRHAQRFGKVVEHSLGFRHYYVCLN